MVVDGKDFGEKVSGVDETGNENKAEDRIVDRPSPLTSLGACRSTWTSSV